MSTSAEQLLKLVLAAIRSRLAPKYGDGEAREMSRIIFENLKGWNPVDLVIRQDELISEFIQGKVDDAVERLLNDEPIQQIFGNARFYGMTFKVTRATLIPRPETAELIDLIVKENPEKDLSVLDAGTGTGCIAIALQRNLCFPQVTAIDISNEALAVAEENAKALRARVTFREADILGLPDALAGEQFDIIVSNPPYIAEHEKSAMERNVLNFEPQTALFVPDSEPLRFYTALLAAARKGLLRNGGRIYFEINPLYANELKAEAGKFGFGEVMLHRDTDGKLRFLSAVKM
jgi:release factor glutamine methyltransferase